MGERCQNGSDTMSVKFLDRKFDSRCGFPCFAELPDNAKSKNLGRCDVYFGGCYGLLCGTLCAPCIVGRAFELLHPQFKEECPNCKYNPTTCLGCGLCLMDGMMPWALAYIGSHTKDQTNCLETFYMCCAGGACLPCCCAPCQIAGEIHRLDNPRQEAALSKLLTEQ